jgi:hypothetical protein
MGVGNLDPTKDTVPDEFQIRASKEKMVHRFLLGTKTTLDIHSYSKLSKLIFGGKSTMSGHPKCKQCSRPSNVPIHSPLSINYRVNIFNKL